jgi:hypothetical protein
LMMEKEMDLSVDEEDDKKTEDISSDSRGM